MVVITPGHFFQWSVELYPFKPGRSSVIHWNRKIPSNSFIRLAWPISFVNEPAHDSTLRVKGVMIRNGLAAGQCLACVFQNIPTHDQWFGLCNKGLTIWFTNRGECLEGNGNFAGAEVLSVIMWEIKEQPRDRQQWRKTNKTDWGRKRERKRENRMTQGEIKSVGHWILTKPCFHWVSQKDKALLHVISPWGGGGSFRRKKLYSDFPRYQSLSQKLNFSRWTQTFLIELFQKQVMWAMLSTSI